MRSLIVLPLVLAMAMAEEQQVMPGQMRTQSQFHSHTQPVEEGNPVGLEEILLEEERLHPGTHHMEEEVPHPHLVQEQPTMKEKKMESFPKKFPEDIGSHNPVPDPHLVEEETQFGAGGETHHHESVHDIHHNAVEEHPLVSLEDGEGEELLSLGTESTFNEDLFEHHPNTGIPEIEPTVGTESAAGMEVVQEPVVLPVTEGKNSRQDTVVHYQLPKELMPIHPGGGSKFEDLEKEKLEKKKMAQTKDTDDDTENGASHEAEGLYSSAATLCLSSIIFSLSSSFRLIV